MMLSLGTLCLLELKMCCWAKTVISFDTKQRLQWLEFQEEYLEARPAQVSNWRSGNGTECSSDDLGQTDMCVPLRGWLS